MASEPSRLRTWLQDSLGGILVIWTIPLAIVLVGAPIALGLAGLRWLASWAF